MRNDPCYGTDKSMMDYYYPPKPKKEKNMKVDCMKTEGTLTAVVIDLGHLVHKVAIGYTGGDYDDDCNIWLEELDNSIEVDDIFCTTDDCPSNPGFYVWEGKVQPVYDDAPEFEGSWREATADDMLRLLEHHGTVNWSQPS